MGDKTFEDFKRAFPTLYDHPRLFDFSPPPGWVQLVWELSEKLEPLQVQTEQVKTKFGGLRFYLLRTDSPLEMRKQALELVQEAEHRSLSICEQCGEPGSRALRGRYVLTCCDAHLGGAQRVTETPYGFEPLT